MNRRKVLNVPQKKDKVLVWIGAEFVHFFLAYGLQKKLDADYYAIIDITNKPKEFFINQTLIDFKQIWFYHDEINNSDNKKPDIDFLRGFENKYDINLWNLALNERIFYRFYDFHKFTDDEILSIEEKSIRFFEKVLNQIKPDYFITKQPSFHHLELFRLMCDKSNCKVIMLSFPKIGYRMLISEDVTKIDYVKELEQYPIEGKNFEDMREYLNSHSSFKQLSDYYSSNKKGIIPQLTTITEFFLSNNLNVHTNYNYYGRTKMKVISNLLDNMKNKKTRERFMEENLLNKIDLTKPYIYFPMSTDLERHLLIDSPFYTNQIEVIRHVAKSLPVGYLLYVKENPSNVTRDWRDTSQYKEIMDIPNVELLHPNFSNIQLLTNCDLVISIAGSSSFEAAFYEKPSIVFGNVLYSKLPSVSKVKDLESLPQLIRNALKQKVNAVDLERFLVILKENTFEFNMVEFASVIADKFYRNASTVDVEINESKVKEFIKNNISSIDILSSIHIKKIEQHKLCINN